MKIADKNFRLFSTFLNIKTFILNIYFNSMETPDIIIIGGTTGSGKSTIGQQLANVLDYKFLDGDDLHSIENKHKMAKGIGLNGIIKNFMSIFYFTHI